MSGGYKDYKDAMAYMKCSRDTLDRAFNAGRINKYYLGAKVLFKIDELEALLTCKSSPAGSNDNAGPEAA